MKKLILLSIIVAVIAGNTSAQWRTNGPYAMTTTCVVASGSEIFAGTAPYGGEIFLSTNGGANWTAMNNGIPSNVYVTSIAIGDNGIFAGTEASSADSTSRGGLYLSTNNGVSWMPVNNGLPNIAGKGAIIFSLAISGSNIFAGTIRGVYLSTDNGANWTSVNTGFTDTIVNFINCLAISGSNIFAGTNQGVYLSTNNGGNWTRVNAGLTDTIVNCLAISGSNIFAGTGDGNSNSSGVYLSTNNGASWAAAGLIDTAVRSLVVSGANIFAGAEFGNDADNDGLFLSTNNGGNWVAIDSGLQDNEGVQSLAISGSNIFACSGYGVFLSVNNGRNWTNSLMTGAPTVYSLAIGGSNIFAGTADGVFLSTNNGGNWLPVDTGIGEVSALAISGSNIFAGDLLSTDNGASWTALSVDPSAIAISGSNIFAGTFGGKIYLSTNNGGDWTPVDNGLPNDLSVTSLAISGSNIFAGFYGAGIYLSTNNGDSWTPVNTGLPNGLVVNSLAISASNIFAGTDNGMFLSTNNGANWTAVNNGFPIVDGSPGSVYSLAISGSYIFAGSDSHGVLLSTNNGASWRVIDSGLPAGAWVYSLAVSDSTIFAGIITDGNGSTIWQRSLADIFSVWPGDANDDGIANNNDILAIGLGYGFTGPVRPSASLVWEAQPAPVWTDTFPGGMNMSYADCDGNGVINADDTLAVALNYGLIHEKANGPRTTTDPPLYILFPPMDSVKDGQILQVPVYLGISGNPVDSILGLAFSVNYSSEYIDSNILLSVTGSMMDTSGVHLLPFRKDLPSSGKTDVAITRTDHNNISGYGLLCVLSYQVKKNISSRPTVLPFSISGVTAITAEDVSVPLSYGEVDTVIAGIEHLAQNTPHFTLYPNPANNSFVLETNITGQPLLQVFDMTGKLLLNQTIQNPKTIIDASSLETGVYSVNLKTQAAVATGKLVIVK